MAVVFSSFPFLPASIFDNDNEQLRDNIVSCHLSNMNFINFFLSKLIFSELKTLEERFSTFLVFRMRNNLRTMFLEILSN